MSVFEQSVRESVNAKRQKRLTDDKDKLKESLDWARTIVVDGEDPVPIAVALFETERNRLLEEMANSVKGVNDGLDSLQDVSTHLYNIHGCIANLSETLESSTKKLRDTIHETNYTKEINKSLDELKREVEVFRDRLS